MLHSILSSAVLIGLTAALANTSLWSADAVLVDASGNMTIGVDPGGTQRLRIGGGIRASDISFFNRLYAGETSGTSPRYVAMGYGAVTAGKYSIQALQEGVAYTDLSLNERGGPVIVGPDPGGANTLRVGGNATLTTVLDFRTTAPALKQVNAYGGGDLELVTRTAGDAIKLYTGNGALAVTVGSNQATTFAGPVIAPAATTAAPSIRLPHGTAPSAPVNGDVWTTSSGIYVRINGVTVGPLGAGGGPAVYAEMSSENITVPGGTNKMIVSGYTPSISTGVTHANGRFTFSSAGQYRITLDAAQGPEVLGGNGSVWNGIMITAFKIYRNGVLLRTANPVQFTYGYLQDYGPDSSPTTHFSPGTTVNYGSFVTLAAGDYLELYTDNGGTSSYGARCSLRFCIDRIGN